MVSEIERTGGRLIEMNVCVTVITDMTDDVKSRLENTTERCRKVSALLVKIQLSFLSDSDKERYSIVNTILGRLLGGNWLLGIYFFGKFKPLLLDNCFFTSNVAVMIYASVLNVKY